tara:strand:+ start:1941 stop:3860 length:1920 start_codon:yes stop_codon:yes gene_type:complete
MCGINGVIYKDKKPNLSEINAMNYAIKHRGPDSGGILKFENTILGHVRLSIQDLSSKGMQPMSNDNNLWIIYNGEIYNFKEIKYELLNLGYKFFSESDTEVILNAYKEWGVSSFNKFNGMWCFAILDKEKKELILSRDRYGVKPCYYYSNNKKFIFSSEIKGIFCSESEIYYDNNKIIYDTKTLDGSSTTFFQNIEILPPGSYYKIKLNDLSINKYRWWKGLNNLPSINPNFIKNQENLKELLYNAVKLRLVADEKISISLSGGVDSSIIFSILNHLDTNGKVSLNPFILKENNQSYKQAMELVKHYNREAHLVQNNENEIGIFSDLLATIEMPETYFNQINIYKKQKEKKFKISIDGHGADECLGGYAKDFQLFPMHYQNEIINIYKSINSIKGKSYLEKVINNYKYAGVLKSYNIEIDKLFYAEKIFDNKINQFKKYIDAKKIQLISNNFMEDLEDLKNISFPNQILYFHANYGHMQWLLNKWDKASMANSVEIRSPYLDWNFFQFALFLPQEYKNNNGKNKYILRESFKDILTDTINQDYRKQGLGMKKYDNNYFIKNMKESFNQKSFSEEKAWNGKAILKDFNDGKNFDKLDNKNKIWKIFCLHSLKMGLNNKKEEILSRKKIDDENFNLLTNIT